VTLRRAGKAWTARKRGSGVPAIERDDETVWRARRVAPLPALRSRNCHGLPPSRRGRASSQALDASRRLSLRAAWLARGEAARLPSSLGGGRASRGSEGRGRAGRAGRIRAQSAGVAPRAREDQARLRAAPLPAKVQPRPAA